ncbi:Mur ligase domain-containing protein [Kitasatospora sp. NPDC051984]|uniref:Mur ligase domain-containing protein n=1 Tax=Kitasatospora sp. NPDC051984 TaxID=3364059 RepID=UPI0037CA5779
MDTTTPRTTEDPGVQHNAALPELLAAPHLVDVTADGMLGLALWLAGTGASVTGSVPPALADSPAVATLRIAGVHVDVGFEARHVHSDRTAVVWSTAVTWSHPELDEAQQRRIPVLGRADALTEIAAHAGERTVAVGGSHGTATAAAALAAALDDGTTGWILTAAGRGQSVGGSGATQGRLVVDVCPDAGTHEAPPPGGWQRRPKPHYARRRPAPSCALILTVGANSPHFVDNLDALNAAEQLALSARAVVLPTWNRGITNLRERLTDRARNRLPVPRMFTVGLDRDADVRILPPEWTGTEHRVTLRHNGEMHLFVLPVIGRAQALAVCAAIATALVLGESADAVAERLRHFGVARSLTVLGRQAGITVVESRARHPREVADEVIAARVIAKGAVITVLEPDGVARTRAHAHELGAALDSADRVLLLPVHTPLDQVLDVDGPLDDVHRSACRVVGDDAVHRLRTAPGAHGAAQQIAELVGPGDLVLLIGPARAARIGPYLLAHLAAGAPVQGQL